MTSDKFKLSIEDALYVMDINEWSPRQLILHYRLCDVDFDEEKFLEEIDGKKPKAS